MSWGHIENRRGDPWCGRPATYTRRQTNVGSSPSSTSSTAYQCQKTNVRTCAGQLHAPPKHAFPPWCKHLPHLQSLTPNPSHSFAYMPAWMVAAGVRLPWGGWYPRTSANVCGQPNTATKHQTQDWRGAKQPNGCSIDPTHGWMGQQKVGRCPTWPQCQCRQLNYHRTWSCALGPESLPWSAEA